MKSSDHISGLLFRNRFARILILIVLVVITSRGLFAQPVADFYATPGTVCTGETVYFTDNTQNITGTATYFWNFGPGATPSTATGVGPHAVTYSVLGQVTATLTVTDEVSTDEITKDNFLLIGGEAPSFTSCPGPLLEYSADPGQCNAIVDYSSLISVTGTWEPMLVFTTSGATTVSGHGSGSGTSFNLGSTTVTVFATNGCVPEAICSFVIHVNTPPVARAGGPYEICQGSQATLAGSSSSEPDAACGDYIVTYNWDVDNDGINDLQGITQTLTHAMLTGYGIGEGVHTVRLEAVDAFGGSNYDYTTLTVLPNPAVTLATLSPVCLDATAFNLTQGTPTGGTYSGSGITNSATGLFDPSVAGVGTHTITYTYTDGTTGCTANAINTITVNALPTITVSTAPSCSPDLLTYTLEVTVSSGTVSGSSGTETDLGGYVWRISGVDAGTDITVTVTDGNSCASSVSVTSPDCSCPSVTAPVNGGNQSYCA